MKRRPFVGPFVGPSCVECMSCVAKNRYTGHPGNPECKETGAFEDTRCFSRSLRADLERTDQALRCVFLMCEARLSKNLPNTVKVQVPKSCLKRSTHTINKVHLITCHVWLLNNEAIIQSHQQTHILVMLVHMFGLGVGWANKQTHNIIYHIIK